MLSAGRIAADHAGRKPGGGAEAPAPQGKAVFIQVVDCRSIEAEQPGRLSIGRRLNNLPHNSSWKISALRLLESGSPPFGLSQQKTTGGTAGPTLPTGRRG